MFVAPPPPPARVEAKATSVPSGLHEGSTAVLESARSPTGAPAPGVRMKRPACPFAVETNTKRSPDGAQLGLASIDPGNPNPAVRARGFAPSEANSHIWGTPPSSYRYTCSHPVGHTSSWVSLAALVVSRRSAP